jgi:alpha-glucosidase (family GH31 glycosyl hydrolase)
MRTRAPFSAVVLVGLVLVGPVSCGPGPEPLPDPPTSFVVGDVTIALEPFSITLSRDGTELTRTTTGEQGCAPLAIGLRPDDDEGAYFAPESPSADITWVQSLNATLVDESPLTLDVQFEGRNPARVIVRAGTEGFVDVDVTFDENPRGLAMVQTCFTRADDEHAVGGGERFGGSDIAGTIVPLQFRAPGPLASGTNEAHVPVPFFTTTRGAAFLVENERVGAFDLGASDAATNRIRMHGTTLPLRLRAGTPLENIAAHARRMGLPPMPPRWALAPMLWRNEHEVTLDDDGNVVSTGQDRLLDDARMLRTLDIPTTALWIDAPWQTGYNTFVENTVQFPDLDAAIATVENMGFRVIVWSTEHINSSDDQGQQPGMPPFGSKDVYDDYVTRGFLVGTPDGAPFVFPWARGNGGYVDFSNPAARDAQAARMTPLLSRGVRGFKLDFGETMRADLLGAVPNEAVAFFDGDTTAVHHTRYARLYHETHLQALRAVHPDDHFIITRTGGIFDQKNGVCIWPGDLDNDFSHHGAPDGEGTTSVGGLPAAIHGGLSLALSGYPLYGSDIGGYRGGPPTTEALLRWAAFGALSPIMQLGGGGTGDATHNPWDPLYEAHAVDAFRVFAQLHMSLVPTLESALRRSTTTGTPVLLPLALAFDDDALWSDPFAYTFAHDLLVFPVVEEGATTRPITLPEGTFIDWFTGERFDGPKSVDVAAPIDTIPLYLRAGAVIALLPDVTETLVDADDPDTVDVSDTERALIVRVVPGPTGARTLVDDTSLSQTTIGAETTVVIDGGLARPTLVRIALRGDGTGPDPGAAVTVNGAVAPFTDPALFESGRLPCATVVDNEIRVRAHGSRIVVEVGP